jgi:hypothetical protein
MENGGVGMNDHSIPPIQTSGRRYEYHWISISLSTHSLLVLRIVESIDLDLPQEINAWLQILPTHPDHEHSSITLTIDTHPLPEHSRMAFEKNCHRMPRDAAHHM